MQLKFIGTASGKTSLKRYHSSLLFIDGKKKILIDCGDGISKALLTQKISWNSIDVIVISHFHSDHIAGLPSLLTQMKISGRKKHLEIFVHRKSLKQLNGILTASFLFIEKFKFKVTLTGFDFDKEKKITNNFGLAAKQNLHVTNKYDVKEKNICFISSSFLFKVKGKKIIYTSDIGDKKDLYLFAKTGSDIFITEATHITVPQIKKAVIEQNFKTVVITHYNDEQIKRLRKIVKELKKTYNINAILANDDLTIEL